MQRLCVYCGSAFGNDPRYRQAAEHLGATLAREGISLVYGGGKVGLMGAVADGALAAGGKVIGVIPRLLVDKELAHPGLTELVQVADMHERKASMADLADGFIALPGGFGTWEELFEVITWSQLGLHAKPMGLLDVADYYQPLLGFIHNSVAAGFVRKQNADALLVDADPHALLARMRAFLPDRLDKWAPAATGEVA